MTPQPTDILESLLTSTHRLTRIAAQETGRTTSPAVWRTLSILTTDGELRVGDLARASRVSQPTMTKLLRGLAEDELVKRIADTDDSRAWLIAITDKGTAALVEWRGQLADSLGGLFADLDDDEWAVLEHATRLLASRVGHRAAGHAEVHSDAEAVFA
ncbi:MarR family transcriptional regulator [Frigoribacterium sp. CFBP 8759]|uniref:MarR family winged helix-turn-helix transcriptional regulator n=1 Tax=unclassified Frigoribacterium TaxID=2627005 RepID=UPI0017849B65|nr:MULTISPECIES: MarR family transcriptional regulator [unclassified Frigoribacterium]MBD8141519.1 MarR family transcriptional regulator [Frigoribacterium sp. CFBP 13605]MBD8484192.1 MarR family transcriptional regulator [Frigoribacterium sp. CFBP 8759]